MGIQHKKMDQKINKGIMTGMLKNKEERTRWVLKAVPRAASPEEERLIVDAMDLLLTEMVRQELIRRKAL